MNKILYGTGTMLIGAGILMCVAAAYNDTQSNADDDRNKAMFIWGGIGLVSGIALKYSVNLMSSKK
jgi:hypothetical protein